jgi:hypothetical protein
MAVSLVSDFRYSYFDSLLTRLFMKTFAFLRLKSQVVLPSIILLPRGLYFETTIGSLAPILGSHLLVWKGDMIYKKKKKQTPWPESASELCRPSDHLLSAKLVPTLADRGCRVVSVTDLYGRILGFLDRSRYFFFQVAPQLYPRSWVDPVPDPLLLRKCSSAGNPTRTSGSVARHSDH